MIKIVIETLSIEEAYNNEEVKIVRYFNFDKIILDLFNPFSLITKIITEESIDSDTITKIIFEEE